ncbi:hypothetical protein C8C94_4935 [Acidovorax sp. 94]|nr:hypothetical protein C8C94_4935 [Acidovorax sp. 94]
MSRWRRGVIASCGWCLGFWGDFGPWRLSRERGVLLFLKSCGALLSVRAELVEACSCWLGQHAWVEGGGRESPGMRVTFFCFAKRKSPKKRRPPVCDPCASLRGKPASGRLWGAPQNSLRACGAPLEQLRRVRARSMGAPTPMPPRNRPAAGAASRGLGTRTSNIRIATRAFASLGLTSRAQAPRAAQTGPSEAMARMDVRSPGSLQDAPRSTAASGSGLAIV